MPIFLTVDRHEVDVVIVRLCHGVEFSTEGGAVCVVGDEDIWLELVGLRDVVRDKSA